MVTRGGVCGYRHLASHHAPVNKDLWRDPSFVHPGLSFALKIAVQGPVPSWEAWPKLAQAEDMLHTLIVRPF